MANSKKEPQHTAEHLLSEAQGDRSREAITVTGGNFPAGTVLGKITADGTYTRQDPAATNGSEHAIAIAILYAPVDATTDDQKATVHLRDCEVIGSLLHYKEGITTAQKETAAAKLAESGVIIR